MAKRVAVVGASSDIGRALAADLASLGLSVSLWGRDRDRLEATAAACGAFAVTVPGDWEGLPSRDELATLGHRPGTVQR